jgi:hypothetical protein
LRVHQSMRSRISDLRQMRFTDLTEPLKSHQFECGEDDGESLFQSGPLRKYS